MSDDQITAHAGERIAELVSGICTDEGVDDLTAVEAGRFVSLDVSFLRYMLRSSYLLGRFDLAREMAPAPTVVN